MNLVNLFKDKRIGDIWPIIHTPISFQKNTTIKECFQILDKHGILSAPILGNDKRMIGFIDVLDLIVFITRLIPENVNSLSADELTKELQAIGTKFDDTPISEVAEYAKSILMYNERIVRVKKSTPITELVDIFFQGVHRVPVMSDDDSQLLGIVSQTDLINILAQCMPILDREERSLPISQLGLGEKESLIIVHKSEKVIHVLKKMNQALKRPVSAVPIVDDDGKLIANFSATNLKGINQTNFSSLALGVYDFLKKSRDEDREKFQKTIQVLKSLHPITCTLDHTFQSVVFYLVTNRVHRLWVVDKEDKPIGVVAMTDLFKVFLPWASPLNSKGVMVK